MIKGNLCARLVRRARADRWVGPGARGTAAFTEKRPQQGIDFVPRGSQRTETLPRNTKMASAAIESAACGIGLVPAEDAGVYTVTPTEGVCHGRRSYSQPEPSPSRSSPCGSLPDTE
jgi:hypothetical protein